MKKLYKFDKFINEGIRDKMKPKSLNDIRKNMIDFLEDHTIPGGVPKNFLKTGVFDSSDRIIVVEWHENFFHEVNTYFKHLTENSKDIFTIPHGNSDYTFICYPSIKAIEEKEKRMEYRWYFGYEHVDSLLKYISEKQKVNEGIRDMMTPKNREDIIASLSELEPYNKIKMGTIHNYPEIVEQGFKEIDKSVFQSSDILQYIDTAMNNRNLEIVRLFLDNSEVTIKRLNSYLISMIQKYQNLDMVKLFHKHGADLEYLLNFPAIIDRCVTSSDKPVELIKYLVENSPKIKSYITGKYIQFNKLRKFYGNYVDEKVTESVRDFMKPKSKEELREYIEKLLPGEKLRKGMEYGVLSKEEAYNMISRLDPQFKLSYGIKYDLLTPQETQELFEKIPLFDKIVFMHKNCYSYDSDKLRREFDKLTEGEKNRILLYGMSLWFITDSWQKSETGRKEAFDKLLKKLRKTSNPFKESKIHESIRDKMTPISKDQIRSKFDKFHPVDAIIKGIQNNLPWLVDEMIQDMISKHGKETTAAILQNLGPYQLEKAMESNRLEILEILLKAGYKVNQDRMKWAVVNGSLEAIKMLVKYGGVVDSYVINHCQRYRPNVSINIDDRKPEVIKFLNKTYGLGNRIKDVFRNGGVDK